MNDRFEEILNTAIDRVVFHGEPVEDVVKGCPEHADDLRPLLLAALKVHQAASLRPEASFKNRSSAGFRSAVISAQPRASGWGIPRLWHRGWVTVASVVLALFAVVGTTAFAASGSMPDQPLYQVKLATEQIETAVTASPLGRAKLEARLADKRIEELSYVIDRNRPDSAEELSKRLYSHYSRIEHLVEGEMESVSTGDNPSLNGEGARPKTKPKKVLRGDGDKMRQLTELRKMLKDNNPRHEEVIRNWELRAQGAVRPEVGWALEHSLKGHQQAITAVGDGD